MNPKLLFGDIFIQDEKEYIFLGKSCSIKYVAKILDQETSMQVEKIFLKRVISSKATNVPLYAFVELATHESRIASLTNPILEIRKYKKINNCVEEDKTKLIEEILSSRSVPLGLKELFSL